MKCIKKNYVALLLFMFCCFDSVSQIVPLEEGNICEDEIFNLVFEDNFDGPLDQNEWYTYFPYGEGDSDQCEFCRTHDNEDPYSEGQIYQDENVRTDGGSLFFDIKNEPATWYTQSKNYTSGMIHSKKKFGYGKYEIRCKIPSGYAHFNAFWIQDGSYEIDIFESWGPQNGTTDKFKCSVHNYEEGTFDFWVEPDIDLSLDFHTYTVIYGENMMFFYFDDELIGKMSRYSPSFFGGNVDCDINSGYYYINSKYPPVGKQFRVIANAAVVGGPATNNEVPEGTMEIDYIKVYEFDTCIDTPVACHEGTNNPIVFIDEDTEWNTCDIQNIADQYKYITVRNNSTLVMKDIEIKMLMPGRVKVESGSTLLLDNSTIRPCEDGARWQGVYLENGASIKMKNQSVLKSSILGIYNNPDFNDDISSLGGIDQWSLEYSINPNAGNNSVILNNSSLEDNLVGILLDGDENIISLVQGNTSIKGSSYASLIRGNMNGYIEYKDVTFEDNQVALWADNCGDRHVIRNCEFVNNYNFTTQITLKDVDGLDFQMNRMEGPGYLIDAFESYVDIVNNNEFRNAHSAVWVAGAYPLASGARIGDMNGAANYFVGNDYGITVNGLNSAIGGRIRNNQIENINRIAIDVKGISLSRINNNSIDNAEDGVYFSKTGGSNNFINCNRFVNNGHQDLTIELDNNRTLFLQNDFSGSQNEGNIILSLAKVNELQGTENNPSDNCFDPNAIEDLYTDPNTSFFEYRHNEAIPCRIPSGNGNYQALSTQSTGDNCPEDQIGSNFVGVILPPNGFTAIHMSPSLAPHPPGIITPNVDDAVTDVVNTGGDDPYTYADESLPNIELLPNVTYSPVYLAKIQAIYNYESELDYWIRVGIQYAITNDDYAYGESLLLPFKKWRWQEMLFGLYMKSRQYSKARALLTTLPSNTAYEAEFIDLQHINLDRIINGRQSITPAQIQTVYSIATGNTPATGYAIPIYYHLTGIRLASSVPTKSSGTRNSQERILVSGLSIAPNPAMDQLMLRNESNRKLSKIEIIDRYYQIKIKLTGDNLDRINISNLESGWYMMRCIVDDEIITLPFVKL